MLRGPLISHPLPSKPVRNLPLEHGHAGVPERPRERRSRASGFRHSVGLLGLRGERLGVLFGFWGFAQAGLHMSAIPRFGVDFRKRRHEEAGEWVCSAVEESPCLDES